MNRRVYVDWTTATVRNRENEDDDEHIDDNPLGLLRSRPRLSRTST